MTVSPSDLATLLEQARTAHNPLPADEARVLQGLRAALDAAGAGAAAGAGRPLLSGAHGPAAGSAFARFGQLWSKLGLKLAIGALMAGAAAGALWLQPDSPEGLGGSAAAAAVAGGELAGAFHRAGPEPRVPAPLEPVSEGSAPIADGARAVASAVVVAELRSRAEPRPSTGARPGASAVTVAELERADGERADGALATPHRLRNAVRRSSLARGTAREPSRAESSSAEVSSVAALAADGPEASLLESATTQQPASVGGVRPARLPSVANELALVRGAHAALRDGQPNQALLLLSRHAREYPQGVLREERLGVTVLSLCALGRTEAGLAKKRAFLTESPQSPLAQRVRGACLAAEATP